jgi:hypothetical protein
MLIDISGNPAITDHHELPPGRPGTVSSEAAGLDDPLEEGLGAGSEGSEKICSGGPCSRMTPWSRKQTRLEASRAND